MSGFLHFLVNISVLLASLLGYLAAVALSVGNTRASTERIVRGLTVFLGTLTVTGAEAAGLTFSSFAVSSLTHHHGLAGLLVKAAWVIFGGGVGWLVARYLLSKLGNGTNLQVRVMILVTIIAHVELIEIYAQNVRQYGFDLGAGALPDITFIGGLLCYVVFNYDTGEVRAVRDRLQPGPGLPWLGRSRERWYERQDPLLSHDEEGYPNIFGEQP
jgi:hypothetical protein